jgi:hypothetical protein
MKFWVYPLVLFAISVYDLVNTCMGIHFGSMEERNPIAIKVLEAGGIPLLVLWKLSITIGVILFLEILWRRKLASKQVVEWVYLIAILAYVVLFTVGILLLNFL